jgi:hypothetical protein
MRSYARGRTLGASAIAIGIALAGAATASADPADTAPVDPQAAAPADPQATDSAPDAGAGGDAATTACKQFSEALGYAASNYEDFAYNSAGGGNNVDYADPNVQSSNVVGRTALREAASSAMNAAMTPGLPGDISAPMQSWSLHATKLLVIMGLHGGGDSLNDAATNLNTDATNAQMACALAGTSA